jgi:hypothetical protein
MRTPASAPQAGTAMKALAKAAVLGLLTFGVVSFGYSAPAIAAGTSPTVHNCYTQWWNTAWGQGCVSPGATNAGTYKSEIACSLQGDKTLSRARSKNSTTFYSGTDCRHSASNGKIWYGG